MNENNRANVAELMKHFFIRAVREPLVHFLFIGLMVFFAFGETPRVVPKSGETIEITQPQIDRLAGQFRDVWRRDPTPDELAGLVEGFVRETVYYREALALGLDRDDAVIRRRLKQKMEFISNAAIDALTPDDPVLQRFIDENATEFTIPARVTFQQIFLGAEDPEETLTKLAEGVDPAQLGRGSLLPGRVENAVASAVDGTFGAGFFDEVRDLPTGDWRGPIPSSYGPHLVLLVSFVPAAVPALADVRDQVEGAWRQQEAERLREAQYQVLRGRYEVVLPDPQASE